MKHAAFLASTLTMFAALSAVLLSPSAWTQPVAAAPADCPALLQHSFPRLQDDKPQALSAR